MFAGFAHEPQIKRQIVDRRYLHGKQLLGYEKVAEISLGIYSVHIACSVLVNRGEVIGPFEYSSV